MAEIEQERVQAHERLEKAKKLLVRLLTGYEMVHSGAASWADPNFDVNLTDAHKFLQELERAS